MAQLEPYVGDYYLWQYIPSLPAAVIFLILFLAITGAHGFKIYKTRLWFCLPFVVGGIRYGARAAAHNATGELIPYIIQSTLTLLPPVLFAASIYMVLGRIIRAVQGEPYSPIRPGILTKVFVAGDAASFCIQGGGAGILAMGGSGDAATGEKIVVGGLLVQIVAFGLFIATAVLFQARYRKYKVAAAAFDAVGWRASMNTLYGVSALIMVRSVFRVVEFAAGHDGYPLRNEWTFYVFDSVLMWVVMVVFFWYWPDNLQPGRGANANANAATLQWIDSNGTQVDLAERGQNK
ncbi:hypothetical protein Hte_009096 [Hypoxylon texense]